MSLTTGDKLGPYEILAAIGKGGMGEVFRARDPRLRRDVAIKVSGEHFSERFEREARAIATLNHPNVCALYDVGPDYLVMELVDGETLDQTIRAGPLPEQEVLSIAGQIAAALEEAHEKGITHRDLKPANIKIKADGVVKVLDFGLAKLGGTPSVPSEDSPTLTMDSTQAGIILGTAAYMSPEQARGKRVDRRADIWAFGVVVYEMLTGARLFRGESVTDVLAAVIERTPELASVPPRFRPLLRRCLEKDPKKRLRDIGDAMPLTEELVLPPPARPRPWRYVAAALAFGASMAASTYLLLRSRPTVETSLVRLPVDLGLDAFVNSLGYQAVAISPDGRRIVYQGRDSNGRRLLFTRLLDQPSGVPIAGTEGAAIVVFSPDGQWIAFNSEGKLRKVPLQGGPAVALCDAPNLRGASWGPSGIVATLDSSANTGLSLISPEGGPPLALTRPTDNGEQTQRWPQLLPDGDAVVFTGHTSISDFEEASIEVLSLKTHTIKTLQRRAYFGRYVAIDRTSGYLVYMHEGVLFGVPMDPGRLDLRGTPEPLLQDVAANITVGSAQFEFSGTGVFIYRNGKASGSFVPLTWLDASGKTELILSEGTYFTPRISPDGQRVAFSTNSGKGLDLYIRDTKREVTSRLTFDSQGNSNPVWTSDGRHIVYRSSGRSGDSIRYIRSDGGESIALRESKSSLVPSSLGPKDQTLAYSEAGQGMDTDLWTLPLDIADPERPKAGTPQLFLKTPAAEYAPAFSPDGRWIAYATDESGRFEVFVRPFPGDPSGRGARWQVSNGGGTYPLWSKTADELFYKGSDNRIYGVPFSAKDTSFASGMPRMWSNIPVFTTGGSTLVNLDLASDGKRFAIMIGRPPEDPSPLHLTFLINFSQELRRRSGNTQP